MQVANGPWDVGQNFRSDYPLDWVICSTSIDHQPSTSGLFGGPAPKDVAARGDGLQDSALPTVEVNELTPVTVSSARGLLPVFCGPIELTLKLRNPNLGLLRTAAQ